MLVVSLARIIIRSELIQYIKKRYYNKKLE